MFTKGQLIFAVFFVVLFVTAMVIAYRKDKALHERFYKGNYKILLAFIGFVLFLFAVKIITKH
ncbi:hypothetical protein [Flavobacterium sp.]|jgi:threonine/homoserine/homoserine lactone efflux protein|uniref:hypothetical protein n=1 Tax=Flavobacterium sp. TaxID=239 RepID=UPI002609D173|nr:hypothetical protein [Flavobacterium sp.]